MKIKVLGAAGGEVTGSCYLVETSQARIMVDCGMFQGSRRADELNRQSPLEEGMQLDAVVLTHAHLDHVGRIPVLLKAGYRGPIFATSATIDLMMIILEDSARIQVHDVERINRKRKRAGDDPVDPLYDPDDIEPIRSMTREVKLHAPQEVAPGISARYFEAGHMLGSTSIELTIQDGDQSKTVVFSGDLGSADRPVLRDFESVPQADLVFMESTYGDHNHRPYSNTVEEFEAVSYTHLTLPTKRIV